MLMCLSETHMTCYTYLRLVTNAVMLEYRVYVMESPVDVSINVAAAIDDINTTSDMKVRNTTRIVVVGAVGARVWSRTQRRGRQRDIRPDESAIAHGRTNGRDGGAVKQ
jgi:hypothetical protein